MPRKTMRMSEIRALTNRYLAGSDPELVEFRKGVVSMYEHLAMAANDYHGFNDIVQIWSGEPGKSTYVEDTTCRRQYFGEMSGPDAQAAEDFIKAYRASTIDPELSRRRGEAALIRSRDRLDRPSAHDTTTRCHCGALYHGADHCPACGCEQFESLGCDYIKPRVLRRDVPTGQDGGWLVAYRGEHFVISTDRDGDVQAFRANVVTGQIKDWDEVARGTGKQAALDALIARPVDDDGRVLSPRDVLDAQQAEMDAAEEAENAPAGCCPECEGS